MTPLSLSGLLVLGSALGAEPPPLVLYGPAGPDVQLEIAAVEAWEAQVVGTPVVPRVRHVSTLLGEVPPLEVVGAEVLACPGAPLEVISFTDGLALTGGQLRGEGLAEAEAELERLEALLPCLSDVLPGPRLGHLFALQGVARALRGDEAAARERYRRALLVSPQLRWDPSLPEAARPPFEAAFKEALRTEAVAVDVGARLRVEVDLWIDGVEVSDAVHSLSLGEGRHLIQWLDADGGFGSRLLDLRAGDQVAILGRPDVAAAVLGGDGGDLALERARAALAPLAEVAPDHRVFLAEFTDGVPLLHAFDLEEAAWSISDRGEAERLTLHKRGLRQGRLAVLGGGAMVVAGGSVGVLGFYRARNLYDDAVLIEDRTLYEVRESQYHAARATAYVGYGVLALGVASVTYGVVVLPRRTAPGPRLALVPGPAGLAVRVDGL